MGKHITKQISNTEPKWAFENARSIKLNYKKSRILTRGTGQRFFTMPASMIKSIQKALVEEGVSMSEEKLKKCVWVMDIVAIQTQEGENFKVDVKNI